MRIRDKLTGRIMKTHGGSYTRLFNIWGKLKQRCLNPKAPNYHNYGGRGISVCPEWLEFESFRDWALSNGYTEKLTIDRIDNDGNYEPGNCRWATAKEQANNRRDNRRVKFYNSDFTIKEWAKIIQIPYPTLLSRFNLGWPVAKALTTPRKRALCSR